MIEQLAKMPKYEAYKDSGVEWLGEIPAHWNYSFPRSAWECRRGYDVWRAGSAE